MKVYILEDEKLVLQHLLQVFAAIPYIQIVGHSEEIAKAGSEIPEMQPDLVLADIRLKDGDSFKLFSNIATENFQIIFLTAYDEYALRALQLGAFGYLLKPFDEVELTSIVEKCYRKKEHERFTHPQMDVAKEYFAARKNTLPRRIALKSQEYIEIISIDDIIFCKSDKGYTTFYLNNSKNLLVSKGLKDYEQLLEPMGFLRCHQSYLINPEYIKKYYKEGTLQMQNGENIPVSTRKKEEVLNFLNQLS